MERPQEVFDAMYATPKHLTDKAKCYDKDKEILVDYIEKLEQHIRNLEQNPPNIQPYEEALSEIRNIVSRTIGSEVAVA